MHRTFATALLAAAFAASAAQAGTIDALTDNFATENGGAGTLNYFGFNNFTVSAGSVDLIGNGFFDNYRITGSMSILPARRTSSARSRRNRPLPPATTS